MTRCAGFAEDTWALDFWLAEHLGMTVAEVRERVSHVEWLQWSAYLGWQDQKRQLAEDKWKRKHK